MTATFHLSTLILLPFDSVCTNTLIIIFNRWDNETVLTFALVILLNAFIIEIIFNHSIEKTCFTNAILQYSRQL